MVLTNNQYDGLNKIATKSKMDCWFWIRQKHNGKDYVFDLEENRKISWKTALTQLSEGIVNPPEFYDLNEKEVTELRDLFDRFGINLFDKKNF